ncbi:MAG: hypothetical protein ACLPKI_28665 [Streptosporangiaceae bacterium]
MSDNERPTDGELTRELRDSLSELAVPERPPLAAITGRGRVHQRRRRAGFAGLGGATAAVVIALALGLAGVFGTAPPRSTGTAQTADFILTSYVNGTVSLRLGQVFDPAALQRALAQHGIAALVKTDTYCSSNPAVPARASRDVLNMPDPGGTRQQRATPPNILMTANFPVKPSQLAPSVDPVTTLLSPAAMPPRTELFIGNYDLGHTIFVSVIYTGSHTCQYSQEPPGAPWVKNSRG